MEGSSNVDRDPRGEMSTEWAVGNNLGCNFSSTCNKVHLSCVLTYLSLMSRIKIARVLVGSDEITPMKICRKVDQGKPLKQHCY